MYEVRITKKARKRIERAPETVQILFDELAEELRDSGPIRSNWPNFSKLGAGGISLSLEAPLGGVLAPPQGLRTNRGLLCRFERRRTILT